MILWLTILGMGAVTLILRVSFLFLLGKVQVPPLVTRALRFVPAAVLSAIILPDLMRLNGSLALGLHNPRPLAGLVAALVAWRTKNVLLTIMVGMASLLLLQYLLA